MKGFVHVYKLYVKCSESRRLSEAMLFLGKLCFLAPYLCALYKYKNVIKNNTIRSVLHIIVCLLKIE